MGLSRRSNGRGEAPIWPGFVDAMTSLLLVLMFVLTIFMVVQFILRETITTQGNQLNDLSQQLAGLADQLGLARKDNARLTARVGSLDSQLSDAQGRARQQDALIATLGSQLDASKKDLSQAQAKITSFEQQVASLLAARDKAQGQISQLGSQVKTLTDARDKLATERQALELAVAKARSEVNAQQEAARLAAAKRDAMQTLIDDLKSKMAQSKTSLAQALAALQDKTGANATLSGKVDKLQQDLSASEKARLAEAAAAEALKKKFAGAQDKLTAAQKQQLVDAAAAQALRAKLKSSQDELTAMTLALEQQRKRAEDTLTMLAAAQAAKKDLDIKLAAALAERDRATAQAADAQAQLDQAQTSVKQSRTEIEHRLAAALAAKIAAEAKAKDQLTAAQQQAALLSTANQELARQKAVSADGARKIALLNQQVAALRDQLQQLQGLLDASAAKDKRSSVQIESLGNQLNAALARVATEEKKRADLEAAARKRLEAQNKQLANYRSEFFGKVRAVIAGLPGVKIVGDRFVFSSEVLFAPGSADLSDAGKAQIANVVKVLEQVAQKIPPSINWILQVNGYTDTTPLSGNGPYKDNWALSQARALSVVHYMIDHLGFPADRLAASGYGEYHPVVPGDTPQARAQNRRIELKLTEN